MKIYSPMQAWFGLEESESVIASVDDIKFAIHVKGVIKAKIIIDFVKAW